MKTDEQLIGDVECICGALPRVNELIRRYRELKAENEAALAEIERLKGSELGLNRYLATVQAENARLREESYTHQGDALMMTGERDAALAQNADLYAKYNKAVLERAALVLKGTP